MKRIFDLIVSSVLVIALIVPCLIISIIIKLSTKGPILYWSSRVGKDNRIFQMPKFRTMYTETPVVATHELSNANGYITPIGKILRKTSLDEIPQLWCILRSEMSLVGPRPALFNQFDLISMRTEKGIHILVPGLTGWAQVNGRDELDIESKVKFEYEYLMSRTFSLDMKIILLTFVKVLKCNGVMH